MLGDFSPRIRIVRNTTSRLIAGMLDEEAFHDQESFLFTDIITDVSVVAASQDVVEGGAALTLSYSSTQGPVVTSTWYFKGLEVVNSSQYRITQKGLTINQPNRNDTGLYSVVLRNPFSNVTQSKSITVLCKWV